MSNPAPFISGLLVGGYLIIALFFLRFWRDNRNRLFGFFAAAFFTLAVQRTGLTVYSDNARATLALYALRIFAFLLIITAIIDANRARKQ
jgi:hypothetical protein